MSTDRDVTRIVRSWLHEDAHEDADRILGLVLDEIDATPQRRFGGWLARTVALGNHPMGLALAAVVAVAIVLGISLLLRPSVGDLPEATSTPRPSASPISVPGASWPLDPGTYSLVFFPVDITFVVPTGWHSCSESLLEQSVCFTPTGAIEDTRVSFVIVENVVADPCSPGEEPLEPPVGPSVDDLVAAISSLEGFDATAPIDLIVDGYRGKSFALTTPLNPACNMKTWATADRTNNVSPGEVNLFHVLDVNGARLVITGDYFPEEPASAALRAAVEQIIASVQIWR